jgi:hypothetical protein
VILTNHVTDNACRLFIGLVPVVVQLSHRKQGTAMDRFQPVTHIRQCAPDNYAHGVIQVRLLHLVFEIDRDNFFREIGHLDGLCSTLYSCLELKTASEGIDGDKDEQF